MHLHKILYFAIALLLTTAGCRRSEPTGWRTEVYGPLAHGRITIDDIVPDSLLATDEMGIWHLVLHQDLTDFDLDSLVEIPDTTIRKSFEAPFSSGQFELPANTVFIDEEDNNLINVNDVELKEVIMRSGILEYSIRSYINGYLTCVYDIPGVTYNGIGTTIQTTTEPSTGGIPYIFNGEIDLAGYRMDLTGETGFMSNRVYSHLVVSTAADAPQNAIVAAHDSIVIELKFNDPVVEYARGYFGQHHYALNQTVDFTGDVNLPSGGLNLDEVNMSITIRNHVGADATVEFSTLSGLNVSQNSSVVLQHSPLYQPLNITRAFDDNGNVIPTEYSFSLNNINSNIDEFIENLPDSIDLVADIFINPLGDISDGNDFIYTEHALEASMDLDIPLNVGLNELTLTDTLSIAAELNMDADGKLVIYVENAFPFSAHCEAFVIDASGLVLHNLLDGALINAAHESGEPGVTIPVLTEITVPVTPLIIEDFKPDNRILLVVIFDTPGPGTKAIYSDYYMDFQVVADGQVVVDYE